MVFNIGFFNKFVQHILVVILVAAAACDVFAEEIVFVNDSSPYCPYTLCDGGKDGYILDVVNEIYKSAGYTVTIVNVPWNRALLMVNAGTANGILGLEKSSSPNLIYPASAVAKYSVVVFSLASNNWRYSGVESLKNVRLGLIQGTGDGDDPDFANYLKSNPANVTYLATNDTLLHLFKMIEAHHIDATIDDQFAGNYLLEKSGKKNLYKTAPFHQNDTRGYVGFTPKDPKSRHLADVFDAGMARLRKSGKLKSILAAYGMTDWQK